MTSDQPGTIDEALLDAEEESDGLSLRERYGLILGLILIAYVVSGIDDLRWARLLNAVVWGVVLLVALWSPGIPRIIRRVGLVATVVVLVSGIWLGFLDSETGDGVQSLLLAVAQIAAMLAILSRILQHRTVTLQTVMGGVAAYALLAFIMSAIYFGFDKLTETAFFNGIEAPGDYAYFSFVTLTTVGFGDITPASELAKRLVVIEAFAGQVFIITFVARLVSLWGKPLQRNRG